MKTKMKVKSRMLLEGGGKRENTSKSHHCGWDMPPCWKLNPQYDKVVKSGLLGVRKS